ncbi:SAGA-associated factor 29 [Chrysoperla carnea]|uniref:SAGA-associated factor 29 n=1 Tax=Chrysoperla carnea TaxID=189513 RepID=UPI001D0686DF|nr:SAGA-associated factor 29 [Chrysoperla carnea]
MPSNDPPAVLERFKSLKAQLDDIEKERLRNQITLNEILKEQQIAQNDENFAEQRLKALYKKAIEESDVEEALLRAALAKINEIRAIRNDRRLQARKAGNKEAVRRGTLMKNLITSAQTLPLFVGKPGEKPPPLCGAIPADRSYVAKEGDMVVALVKGLEVNWILAEVVSWNPVTKMYEIDDIDDEQKDRHVISKDRVVPLPLMRANPETDENALFRPEAEVLALFPHTTCFYKAKVDQLPATSTDDYHVLFEDMSYPSGYSPAEPVAQRYVIAINQDEHA